MERVSELRFPTLPRAAPRHRSPSALSDFVRAGVFCAISAVASAGYSQDTARAPAKQQTIPARAAASERQSTTEEAHNASDQRENSEHPVQPIASLQEWCDSPAIRNAIPLMQPKLHALSEQYRETRTFRGRRLLDPEVGALIESALKELDPLPPPILSAFSHRALDAEMRFVAENALNTHTLMGSSRYCLPLSTVKASVLIEYISATSPLHFEIHPDAEPLLEKTIVKITDNDRDMWKHLIDVCERSGRLTFRYSSNTTPPQMFWIEPSQPHESVEEYRPTADGHLLVERVLKRDEKTDDPFIEEATNDYARSQRERHLLFSKWDQELRRKAILGP